MAQTARLTHLDALRGLAIILVVGIHAHGYTFLEDEAGLGSFDPIWRSLSGAAVPIFFFVDGFLTARSQNRIAAPRFRAVVRKSTRRLLIPWLIFNLIYVGMRALFETRGMFPTRLIIGQPIGVVFDNIVRSRIAMQLYFLPALFLIRLAAVPLRHLASRPISVYFAILLGYIATTVLVGSDLAGDPISHAWIGFQYFFLGMLVHRAEQSASRLSLDILGLLALIAIAQAFFVLPAPIDQFSYDIAKYGIIIATYLVSKRTTWDNSPLVWVGHRTMQIYLLHAPVLMKVTLIVVAKVTQAQLLRFLSVWALSLLVPILITTMLARFPQSGRIFGEA